MQRIYSVILLVLILTFSSCDINNINVYKENLDVEYFDVKVDSLIVPDSTSAFDTLNIGFCGYVGPNLCYSVSRFEVNPVNEGISIKVIGKHKLKTFCLSAIAGICETYKIMVTKQGYFKIKIINPDNNNLIDSVLVY